MSEKQSVIPQFITPVEDPTIPKDKVVCRDCGQQVPATFAEMEYHAGIEQHIVPDYQQTVADYSKKP